MIDFVRSRFPTFKHRRNLSGTFTSKAMVIKTVTAMHDRNPSFEQQILMIWWSPSPSAAQEPVTSNSRIPGPDALRWESLPANCLHLKCARQSGDYGEKTREHCHHEWKESHHYKCRHVGDAAGRDWVCHPSPEKVQHRSRCFQSHWDWKKQVQLLKSLCP